jgi:hypothetical protein
MVESKPSIKVLIADLFSADSVKELEASGINVHYEHALVGEALTKVLAEF